MRAFWKSLSLAVPMVIILLATVLPVPLRFSIGGMVLGLLFFQLALAGSFQGIVRDKRRYLALRAETDRLLGMVRELNAAVVDARSLGFPSEPHVAPILERIHSTVDRLPLLAGQTRVPARRGDAEH